MKDWQLAASLLLIYIYIYTYIKNNQIKSTSALSHWKEKIHLLAVKVKNINSFKSGKINDKFCDFFKMPVQIKNANALLINYLKQSTFLKKYQFQCEWRMRSFILLSGYWHRHSLASLDRSLPLKLYINPPSMWTLF